MLCHNHMMCLVLRSKWLSSVSCPVGKTIHSTCSESEPMEISGTFSDSSEIPASENSANSEEFLESVSKPMTVRTYMEAENSS